MMELVVAIVVVIVIVILVATIYFILIDRKAVRSIMTYLDEYQRRKKVLGQSHKRHVRIIKWINSKYWQYIYENRERN
jgi:hypothetical protein